jgi:predicted esterase YcpF (UPF0227 family)
MPTLLYLHGFNSSPESKKAQQTRRWYEQNAPEIEFICPALPPYGDAAMGLLKKLVNDRPSGSVSVIGSSMGGFFATCLVEQYSLKAVVVNPAVSPGRGLQGWLGENANYSTGEKWLFEPQHIDEYRRLDPPEIKNKNKYLVLLQSGDEVLDYRDAQQRYSGCKINLESGGDHSFIDYDQHLKNIHQFLVSA